MDNTNTQTTDPNAVPVAGSTTVIDKPTHTIERLKFESGEAEGFEFFVVKYKTLADAVNAFGKGDQKAGEEVVLGLLNSQLRFTLRSKAKSRMPDDEDNTKRLAAIADLKAKGETILLTEIEAENYIPGTREKTSPASILKELLQAKKDGNMELAAELLKSYKEKMAEIENDILSSLTK